MAVTSGRSWSSTTAFASTSSAAASTPSRTTGPLVVIANHPYGILDGLLLGQILAEHKGRLPPPRPPHPPQGRPARPQNPARSANTNSSTAYTTRIVNCRVVIRSVENYGCIGIFPGGTVSTALRPPFGRPMDPAWRRFTARLIAKSGAAVVPVFFEGANSRLFQLASHLHTTLPPRAPRQRVPLPRRRPGPASSSAPPFEPAAIARPRRRRAGR